MDPTTTLFTFMLQTHPSVLSVQLFGSWDNFTIPHRMERDLRRDQSEWRGLHKFDKIICDGDLPTNSERRGGLKMGQKYYYYYEIDGSTETHDPSLPTTTACPFLPGQTVNTLEVPVERRARMKSASMNSLRNTDYKTMEPADRFTAPRLPSITGNRRENNMASAAPKLPKRPTRSVSPAPSWTGTARRFLGFKLHNRDQESDRGRKAALKRKEGKCVEEQEPSTETRSVTPSGSIRSRDMSPESLRKFLSDDLPSSSASTEPTPGLSIPDNIEEEAEDNDDDDNFATTTVCTPSETAHLTTLSPPPFQRGGLSAPPASHHRPSTPTTTLENTKKPSVRPAKLNIPRSHSATSMASSSMTSTTSPISNISRGPSQFSFFDDSEDDEEPAEGDCTLIGDEKKDKIVHTVLELRAPITSYSLPRTSTDNVKNLNTNQAVQSLESPALVARNDNGVPVDSSNFFRLPNVDIGLDDLPRW